MSEETSSAYQMHPDLKESVKTHHADQLCRSVQKMHEFMEKTDLTPIYELDGRLKIEKNLIPEFQANPKEFVKKYTGLELPDVDHLYYIDEDGKHWFQKEDSSSDGAQDNQSDAETTQAEERPWGCAEIRIAVRKPNGGGTIVIGIGDAPSGSSGIPQFPPK